MIEESNPPDKNNPILASEIKFKLTAFSKSISIFLSLLSLFEREIKYLFFLIDYFLSKYSIISPGRAL